MAKITTYSKVAPYSKESEMMVLGCMINSVNGLNSGSAVLQDTDFYFPEHQHIFRVLKAKYLDDKPIDLHLLSEELIRLKLLDAVGGIAYLTTLSQYVGTSAYIEHYSEAVRGKSLLRQMITAAKKIEKSALSEPDDVDAVLDEAQQLLYKISQKINVANAIDIRDILSGVKASTELPYLTELQNRQITYKEKGDTDETITGVPTHFIDLDKMINGFGKSNLIILAARPAMGKTALALNIAENVCFKGNSPIAIFSLEMTAEQLLHRMICSQSEIESNKIIKGSLNSTEFQKIVVTTKRMENHVMIIDDQPGLKITDLRARARRLKETHNIELLVIDYLQLLSGSKSSFVHENRQTEISEISRMLKNLAREINIPILCLSQLSRKVEERTSHKPMMSDLRESGSLEQDADLVMFLFRRDYYEEKDKPGMAELIVAKNRHGNIGTVHLSFRKEIAQFGNYSGTQNNQVAYNSSHNEFMKS